MIDQIIEEFEPILGMTFSGKQLAIGMIDASKRILQEQLNKPQFTSEEIILTLEKKLIALRKL